jgi:hypothetical protein
VAAAARTLGRELVHELSCGLPGDVEVLGQLGDGGPACGEPAEGEAVCWAQVIETFAGILPDSSWISPPWTR